MQTPYADGLPLAEQMRASFSKALGAADFRCNISGGAAAVVAERKVAFVAKFEERFISPTDWLTLESCSLMHMRTTA